MSSCMCLFVQVPEETRGDGSPRVTGRDELPDTGSGNRTSGKAALDLTLTFPPAPSVLLSSGDDFGLLIFLDYLVYRSYQQTFFPLL